MVSASVVPIFPRAPVDEPRRRRPWKDLLAGTTLGSSVVFLCSDRFREKAHRWPSYAANILIHEELHSLGLEENPPSSEQITLQVVDRCGR
ncbi:MAG TPA: hypothetical protein VGS98_16365 [Thermoanaerobaculia bacterium]|nr:hypothetical protein [Thermoanaerobaculia bacterium]